MVGPGVPAGALCLLHPLLVHGGHAAAGAPHAPAATATATAAAAADPRFTARIVLCAVLNIVFFVMIVQKIKRAGSRGAWPDMWRFFAGNPALHEAGAKKE